MRRATQLPPKKVERQFSFFGCCSKNDIKNQVVESNRPIEIETSQPVQEEPVEEMQLVTQPTVFDDVLEKLRQHLGSPIYAVGAVTHEYVVKPTNDYVVQPANNYVVQPANAYVVQPVGAAANRYVVEPVGNVTNDYVVQPANNYVVQPSISIGGLAAANKYVVDPESKNEHVAPPNNEHAKPNNEHTKPNNGFEPSA